MEVGDRSAVLVENYILESNNLERGVKLDFYIPQGLAPGQPLSLLLINDGQDMKKMDFVSIISRLYNEGAISPVVCVGIHCSLDRKMEYGVAGLPDFKGRGAHASQYTNFIFEELLPFIYEKTERSFQEKAFAGFSLGGLMALDIVWSNPHEFSTAAVFSGSLWWRSIDQTDPAYDDDLHRIMHQQVRQGNYHSKLKFFFQCGNMDETKDRNRNGIIDSIEDTRDLITELINKGYDPAKDIEYLELPDGHHDVFTWGRAMPVFLKWKFPNESVVGSR